MNKRQFIKSGLVLFTATTFTPRIAKAAIRNVKTFKIPDISPNILPNGILKDKFGINYKEGYLESGSKLNSEFSRKSINVRFLRNVLEHPEKYSAKQIELASVFFNHKLFFKGISGIKARRSTHSLFQQINKDFGGIEQLQDELTSQANMLKANGWVWLALKNNKLIVTHTTHNNNPLNPHVMKSPAFPLLAIDMHNDAHTGNINDYIQTYFDNINWNFVTRKYHKGLSIQ